MLRKGGGGGGGGGGDTLLGEFPTTLQPCLWLVRQFQDATVVSATQWLHLARLVTSLVPRLSVGCTASNKRWGEKAWACCGN